jgi:hypothetical protein
MTEPEKPFTLVDKKILHLNKTLGQIETNSNNEVIYNLRDHIRLNRGDQVTLYKSFINERGLNAQTISLQQDYSTEWKFLYSIPADPKRIISQNSFIFQEYIPYHNYSQYKYTNIGANGQPLILMKLSPIFIGISGNQDFIIEPVVGRRSIYCPKDNYSVSSLGSLITDQLQGVRLPENDESDYIQANIKANGGFTYQFYDDKMSFHIDLIDFSKTQSVGTTYNTKAYTDFCQNENPADIYPYLKNYLETVCINQKDVYLFADLNVYDKFIQKTENGENLYFYADLHSNDLPIDYFFLPCQIPDADAPDPDVIYGKPAYYAIGSKSCALNFDFENSSRFFIDKLHQPCLYPNQSLSDGSTPLTNTAPPGENNFVGQEFTKFYVNSQGIIYGILPVDNTSAVQVLDFATDKSRLSSDKKVFKFNGLFYLDNFTDNTLYFICKDKLVPFTVDIKPPISLGYFKNAVSISSILTVIPDNVEIVMSFIRGGYIFFFSQTSYWRYNTNNGEWDVINQLIQSNGNLLGIPTNFKYGFTNANNETYVFNDKYYFLWRESMPIATGLISSLNLSYDTNKYFTASPVLNYVAIDGFTTPNVNLLFHDDMFDVLRADGTLMLTNQPIDTLFTGLDRQSPIYNTFQVFPDYSEYWTFDQYFSTADKAQKAFETSLMYRLGFSFSQLGDIQRQIKTIKFPVLSSGISNNLKGITTRQQASLGLQLGASGLGYYDAFKNGAGVSTPYNFNDVVGTFINDLELNEVFFENNGDERKVLTAKPSQVFSTQLIDFFKDQVQNNQFSINYIDADGNNQIWTPSDTGDFTYELKADGSNQITELESTYVPPIPPLLGSEDDAFPANMINPVIVFNSSETNQNFASITILTNSRPLDATDLPDLLGENNFYLIYTNLVNNNFYSANQGDKAGGICGIVSLQFAANDTLFNTESIQFTINQTTILDQIIVRLTNPDGTSPPNEIINKNSAFIFVVEQQLTPND